MNYLLANGSNPVESVLSTVLAVVGVSFAASGILLALRVFVRRSGIARLEFKGLGVSLSSEYVKELREAVKETEEEDRQFVLLKQYHDIGLRQSTLSFYVSLIFAAIGFGVVVLAVVVADKDAAIVDQGKPLLAAVSGVVIDAVSALFIVQSNRARALMADFFDRLRADRKLEQALEIAKALEGTELGPRLQAVLALKLVDAKASPTVLQAIIGGLNVGGAVANDDDQLT